jgi:hypothetical protein
MTRDWHQMEDDAEKKKRARIMTKDCHQMGDGAGKKKKQGL